MQLLKNLWYRSDRLQHRLWFRVAASVVVLAASGALFGTLLGTSYSLEAQVDALEQALSDQNLADEDELAVSLARTGTVVVNGKTYGGPGILDRRREIFDRQGDIAQPRALASLLIQPEVPTWAPIWLLDQPQTTWLLAITSTALLLATIWMALTVPLLLTVAGLCATALPAYLNGFEQTAWMFAGLGLLTFSFALLTRVLLLALNRPIQSLSVAHTVVREASRSRLSLVFIVFLLIALPLIPVVFLDKDGPLRYQVQSFISWSMNATYIVAACLTLVLSCATVAFEIRDRQIWQLVSKPMSRFNYLIGKWIGIVGVNAVLLTIAGLSIFMYIQYLRSQPVAPGLEGQLDAVQLRDAVLTARKSARPTYDQLTEEQLRERVDQELRRNPEYAMIDQPSPELRRSIRQRIQQTYAAQQRGVPPQQARTYTFEGLGEAKDRSASLTLRYRFHILEDSTHTNYPARFFFNEDPNLSLDRRYVPTMSHDLIIGPNLIQDDGTLKVTVANLYQAPPNSPYGTLNFEADDFELLYQVASFESNFIRAMLITLTKLSFLSVLGILFATFLSFPVACLASFTVFLGGSLAPFLHMSLQEFMIPPIFDMESFTAAQLLEYIFKQIVRAVGYAIVFTMGGYGEYKPTQELVQGRYIPWLHVLWSFLRLGVIWSCIALVVGYLIMRSRELAIYSGHG